MIKAVLFDLDNTLITYQPSREQSHRDILHEENIKVEITRLPPAIKNADEYYYQQGVEVPVKSRSSKEQQAVWYEYEAIILRALGIEEDPQLISKLLTRLKDVKYKMVLFQDVLPVLRQIRNNNVKLGIISNIDREIRTMCRELGLETLMDVIVTSREAGASKPSVEIFNYALKCIKVAASEVLYVGDQVQIDVVAAQNAGMRGILIDRDNCSDIERASIHTIKSLDELLPLIAEQD